MRYKEFILRVVKDWATEKMETDSDTDVAHPGK